MKTALNYLAALVAATVLTSLLGSFFSSQFVLHELQAIGADISLKTRLSMTIADLAILQTLVLAFGAALLIAFVAAAACAKFIGGNRLFWYVFAGSSAVITLLIVMSWQLQLMPIAGARSNLGIAFQALAGGLGGYLFAQLTRPTRPE
ncbi:hypothetical protein [Arenicella xantha]|uniref:Uncharacterized protein n=1 Tax=Arenicella xantha TaxID=644221 RepID=A0A395JIH5_9GAMM|nr:hypothetical protein [Arenicella xantha]RBP49673.1 hypothetical protein DFR28_10398 [Arenicella xantha]